MRFYHVLHKNSIRHLLRPHRIIFAPPQSLEKKWTIFMYIFEEYLCRDYNIDLLKINSMPTNEAYFDNILSSGYLPTITLPTRLSTNSSLIDNVFTTNLSTDLFSCILDIHISDYQLTCYSIFR